MHVVHGGRYHFRVKILSIMMGGGYDYILKSSGVLGNKGSKILYAFVE